MQQRRPGTNEAQGQQQRAGGELRPEDNDLPPRTARRFSEIRQGADSKGQPERGTSPAEVTLARWYQDDAQAGPDPDGDPPP
jgi:hypothetical protein